MYNPPPGNPYPDLPTNPMPSIPPSPKKKRKKTWLIIAIVAGALLVLCIGASILGTIIGPPPTTPATQANQATQAPTTRTSQPTTAPQPTAKPTQKPTQGITPTVKPTPTSAVPGPAILGATLNDFTARYGKLNNFSDPANGQYYFSLYGNDKDDLTITFVYNTRVDGILYDAPENANNEYWSEQQAIDACLPFMPSDATYQRQMTVYSSGPTQPPDVQRVYISSSIATLFPASAFTDEHGNTTTPGTIGLILTPWTTSNYLECTVQVGLESD